jgi:hypothetical protein
VPERALVAGSRTASPASPITPPLLISAFSRSRDRVGTAAASARSSRQPDCSADMVAVMIDIPLSIDRAIWGGAADLQGTWADAAGWRA